MLRTAGRWPTACALLAVLAWPPAAVASDAAPRLSLQVDPCTGASEADVRRAASIEMDALALEPGAAAADDVTRVVIDCEGRFLRLTVEDPLSGKTSVRRMDPRRESREARARFLALAAVELVAASWMELRLRRQTPPPVDARASVETRRRAEATLDRLAPAAAAPASRPGWMVGAQGGLRRFSASFADTGGGGLWLSRVAPGWALHADLAVEQGRREVSLGTAQAWLTSVGVGAALRRERSRWAFDAGLGLRAGALRLSGEPASPVADITGASATKPWGGPLLMARAAAALPAGVRAVVTVESGYVVAPVDGVVGGLPELALSGYWFGVTAGLGVAWGGAR